MKTLKIQVIIYTLTDVDGEVTTSVIGDYTLCGKGSDGKYHQYDSYEGINAYSWAEKLGMKVDCYEKTVELNIDG